ncbi:MAG: hypothetical protein VW397_04755 [Candidatus Margulisiibacteriota bacterium]
MDADTFYDVDVESLFGSLFVELGSHISIFFISNLSGYVKSRIGYQEKIVGSFNKNKYDVDSNDHSVSSKKLKNNNGLFLLMVGFTYSFN